MSNSAPGPHLAPKKLQQNCDSNAALNEVVVQSKEKQAKEKEKKKRRRKNREGLLRVSCRIASNLQWQFHLSDSHFVSVSKKGQIHFNEKSTCLNFKTLTPRIRRVSFLSSPDLSTCAITFFRYCSVWNPIRPEIYC